MGILQYQNLHREPSVVQLVHYAATNFQVYEGGHRVPCLMRLPGRVPAGSFCDTLLTVDQLIRLSIIGLVHIDERQLLYPGKTFSRRHRFSRQHFVRFTANFAGCLPQLSD